MPANSDYKLTSVGRWRLALLSGMWSADLEHEVLTLVDAQPWSKHPQTLVVRLRQSRSENEFYLKVFHTNSGWSAFKDVFRISKAFRAWRQGLALSEAGFDVPLTIAAGEQRCCRFLRRAFILTLKLDGQPGHLFLCRLIDRGGEHIANAKRTGLRKVAGLVRRFHEHGFVHGDLVASNIFVSDPGKALVFYFMDNDRTRRYPSWMPQSLWKRNLIQLNRMPLAGITLQDRMRFLRAYLRSQELTKGQRRLARWLERQTRRRRQECDGVDCTGDFRRLMRWSREVSASSNAEKVG
jgi:hypothetical protein